MLLRAKAVGFMLIVAAIFIIGTPFWLPSIPITEYSAIIVRAPVRETQPSLPDPILVPVVDFRKCEYVFMALDLLGEWYHDKSFTVTNDFLNVGIAGMARVLAEEGVEKSLRLVPPGISDREAREWFGGQFEEAQATLIARNNIRAYELAVMATKAILDSLGDSHTGVILPYAYGGFKIIENAYLGIRVIELSDEFIYIDRVISHHNGHNAGLKRFDQIVSVNGFRIVGGVDQLDSILSNLRFMKRLERYKGMVKLGLRRAGAETCEDVALTDEPFPTGEGEMLTHNGHRLHYVYLHQFYYEYRRKSACEATTIVWNQLQSADAEGVVLDLRANMGGSLQDLETLLSAFLPEDSLFFTSHYRAGFITSETLFFDRPYFKLPMVILVDELTSSAAELFAQVLKEHGRAIIVGKKTRGRVRAAFTFWIADEFAISIGLARVVTKDGVDLEKRGVEPDIEVGLTIDDIRVGRDPQLDRAFEEMTKLIRK